MAKWMCSVCGYVYDPDEGDPEGGIAPRALGETTDVTTQYRIFEYFEGLPDGWVCPVCGAEKDAFQQI